MNSSIQKAFIILSYIAGDPGRMSLNEMSRALAMNKTTLFRFLQTLEALHILEKRNNIYVPGIKLFELGSKVPVKQLIIERIHPILENLTQEVNETVNLGEFKDNRILYLDKCESKRSLQIQTRIGSYIFLHCTALGKAAMSILPEAERAALVSRLDLEPKTKNTITDARELLANIAAAQKRGYSLDIEEMEVGLHCVAVPLSFPRLNFTGALSFAGPGVRFSLARMAGLAEKLKETVEKIKQAIDLGG